MPHMYQYSNRHRLGRGPQRGDPQPRQAQGFPPRSPLQSRLTHPEGVWGGGLAAAQLSSSEL